MSDNEKKKLWKNLKTEKRKYSCADSSNSASQSVQISLNSAKQTEEYEEEMKDVVEIKTTEQRAYYM